MSVFFILGMLRQKLLGTAFWALLGEGGRSVICSTWNIWTASFLRLVFDILIQLSNLFLGTTLFESGREWGFILVIALAYFEGGKLKIHECNSFQKLAPHGSSGKKIRYLELVEKLYQFASKYVLITPGRFSGALTVCGGLNPDSS